MESLTPRERQIVFLKCAGDLSHKEIAARLGIAVNTVKNTVTSILSRTNRTSMHGVCWYAGRCQGHEDAARSGIRIDGLRSHEV